MISDLFRFGAPVINTCDSPPHPIHNLHGLRSKLIEGMAKLIEITLPGLLFHRIGERTNPVRCHVGRSSFDAMCEGRHCEHVTISHCLLELADVVLETITKGMDNTASQWLIA